jgi:hypothetical protein
MRRALPILLLTFLHVTPAGAQGGYARPPDGEPPERWPDASALRLAIGPAVRVAEQGVDGGLAASVDVGSRAAGGRLAASWIRVGSDHGLSEYAAEIWIDFGAERRLHPIVSAGAGLARLDLAAPDGGVATSSVGVGLLRGALEYELPIREADARAGIDVEGALPAIRSPSAPDSRGWLLFGAHVTVGF